MNEKQQNITAKGEGDIWVGPHIVLFTDVLNQREAIRKLEKLPTTPEERIEYIRALKESKGKVEGLRKVMADFYAAYRDSRTVVPLEKLTAEQRSIFERWKSSRTPLSFQSFADTVVAFAPIPAVDGVLPVNSVYAALTAAGAALMTCLSAAIAIRGGMDINIAIVASENDVYGPAALEAYRLESEVAQYPRIAVGANVSDFLRAALNSPRHDALTEVHRAGAAACLEFLTTAPDGVTCVHFLGPLFRSLLGEHATHLFATGLAFVRREHERFVSSKNQKLAERYASLREYYERHASEWGVSA